MMKYIFSILFVLAMVSGLSACNTMQGVGKDIEKTGEAIDHAAQ